MAGFDNVESIIVLMMENRSFDNLLGYQYYESANRSPNGDLFDGLTGEESNPMPAHGALVPEEVPVARETTSRVTPNPDPGEEFQHICPRASSPT